MTPSAKIRRKDGQEFRVWFNPAHVTMVEEDDAGNAVIDFDVYDASLDDDGLPSGGMVWIRTISKYETVVKAFEEARKGI